MYVAVNAFLCRELIGQLADRHVGELVASYYMLKTSNASSTSRAYKAEEQNIH